MREVRRGVTYRVLRRKHFLSSGQFNHRYVAVAVVDRRPDIKPFALVEIVCWKSSQKMTLLFAEKRKMVDGQNQ